MDSPENCLAECSVRFIYIQHRVVLSWLFGDGHATDELWVLMVSELFAIACTSKEVTTPCAQSRSMPTVMMSLLFAMEKVQ